ncbi:energy-coupling factor transporter ATPase [Adlercreutzia sp. ZJ242]|uniref:energy-coupling factor transporter ATPase n=1 Tax=Adlercreutzia sp. ZJ242 TaxID=2709409 RepID=UPI001F155212|nr:energy-coupling factor transporter ATPase [Adlercreutzia sp. ZJ242]
MMIRFENVSFHYGGEHGTGEGVDNIDLAITEGECVVFCGRSGCGKTTITRLINGLAPHFFEGVMEGAVYIGETCVTTEPLSVTASLAGSVFQNPKSQFFNVDTTGELSFGCENLGMERDEIRARVARTTDDLQLQALVDRNIFELSGGEKQQIAFGSVYATDPLVYVMDEPSSNLDRAAMHRLHDVIARVKAAGKTVVVSEHRLHFLMDIADRFIYLDDGRIAGEYTPEELAALTNDELRALGLRTTNLDSLVASKQNREEDSAFTRSTPAIEALDLSCVKGGAHILDIERLNLPTNSIIALIGDNGSGKSTLSEALCGVIPSNGGIAFEGSYLGDKARAKRSFMVMQDVNRQLFSDSSIEEVLLNASTTREEALAVLDRIGLTDCANRHPNSLSGGQKQRVAIASALCAGKDIIFYDEPTSGLDREGMELFATLLRDMKDKVGTQVIVTHDPELIMAACTHVLRMDNGRVVGIYPLNAEGRERVIYYFTSKSTQNTSRKRDKRGAIARILSYEGKHKRKTIAAAAAMTVGALFSVIPYLLAYRLIDAVVQGQPLTLESAAPLLIGILACLVMHAMCYMLGLSLSHRGAYETLYNIRCSLQEKLDRQPIGCVRDRGSGALKKLFTDDIESIELLLAHMIPEGIANISVPAVALLAMAAIDWRLCLLTVIIVAFGVSVSGQMYEVGMDRMGSYFAATKRLNNTIVEYVNGMEVVRVFNRSGDAIEKIERAIQGYRDFALAWYEVCWPWMAVYGSIFWTITLYTLPVGALFILLGTLSVSEYILVLCMSFGIGQLLSHIIGFMGSIPQVNYKIQALEKALDRPPLREGNATFSGTSHDIVLDDVHFGYGNDEVLKGISFTAYEGQMTAVVGPSGSGKSTIAKLVAHYYDIESGKVSLGGQNICDMRLEELNNQIAYVSQEQFLFNQSILENIRIGKPCATDTEVKEAARKAMCEEFISQLPHGYNTQAGAAGGMLSGGQRQRIAFARAMLKDAPVIVLDEATAYVDPENTEKMSAAIAELVRNKTVIVIAHRLSTIVDADKILVLDGGAIVDEGTHEQLLARCALYRDLWAASERASAWSLKGGDAAC